MAASEQSKATLLDEIDAHDEPALITHLRAIGITSSGIIRGAVQFGSMQVILPIQMSLMFHKSEAHMLGLCIMMYGASKFCEPIYGLLCDHWVSSYGRRLPLLFLSNLLVFISLCVMGYCVLDNSRGAIFMCGFGVCMFSINVAEVAYHGIIADEAELRPRTRGILSGYKTAWFIGGAAFVQCALMVGFSTFSIYVGQIISVPIFLGISAISMHVAPSLPSEPPFKLTLKTAAECYHLSPSTHGLFFWVTVSYFFASGGLQWERFMYFFVRDCISPSANLAKIIASRAYLVCLVASACGAICYSAFGFIRSLGNRRCFMMSTFLISFSTLLLILVETPLEFYFVSVSVGISSGLMLSSSFALALEHIPQGHLESLSLCLFRVYGSGTAQFLYVAPLLNYFGGRNNSDVPGVLGAVCSISDCALRFHRSGYTAIFWYGGIMLLISTAVTYWRIKETAPSKH